MEYFKIASYLLNSRCMRLQNLKGKKKQPQVSEVWQHPQPGWHKPLPSAKFLGIRSGVRSKPSLWQSRRHCFHSVSFRSSLGATLAWWVLLAESWQGFLLSLLEKYKVLLTEAGGNYCIRPNEMLSTSTKQSLYLGNQQGAGYKSS